MSEPFVGQIIAVGFNFAPVDWALCDGRSLSISEYDALYSLIGTTYGGNGTTTFNLPDLRGRAALGVGQGPGLTSYVLGETVGTEQVTLTNGEIGAHTHRLMAAASATDATPGSNTVLGQPTQSNIYLTSGATTPLSTHAIGAAPGNALPHENRQPYQTINYIISLFGVYPSHN